MKIEKGKTIGALVHEQLKGTNDIHAAMSGLRHLRDSLQIQVAAKEQVAYRGEVDRSAKRVLDEYLKFKEGVLVMICDTLQIEPEEIAIFQNAPVADPEKQHYELSEIFIVGGSPLVRVKCAKAAESDWMFSSEVIEEGEAICQ